jgi:hypothetical protein
VRLVTCQWDISQGAKSTGYGEPRGLGLVFFAAVMLLVVGIFNVSDGIAAIANSHFFVANAHYVIGDLRAWGWVALILGLNLISQLFFIPAYPFWALTIIAFDVFALYGLCVYGSRANVTGE